MAPPQLRELVPGVFERIYKGQEGFIYSLDPEGFVYQPNLMRRERVHFGEPTILSMDRVPDIWLELQASDIELTSFD
jgi:hypothetical protein